MPRRPVLFCVVLCVLVTCSSDPCPFPGMTTFTQRWVNSGGEDSAVTWANRRAFDPGDEFEFDCPRRSQLPGQKKILVCRSDGTWSATLPRCDRRLVTHDLVIHYWDEDMERFRPRIERNCSEMARSDRYRVSVPIESDHYVSYVEIRLCSVGGVVNVTLDGRGSCVEMAGINQQSANEFVFSCETLVPEASGPVNIRLNDQVGLFRASVYINEGRQCGWPPVPAGGSVATEPVHGETTSVNYTCDSWLQTDPNASPTSTCDAHTGQWTLVPKCLCSSPSLPPYVIVLNRTGNIAEFQCNSTWGYFGNGTVRCNLASGLWTQPLCQSLRSIMSPCPDLEPVLNAAIVHAGSETIKFECRDGMQMIGPDTISCDVNTSQWLQAMPICTCRKPDPVANARMSWNVRGELGFHCDEGFHMFGSANVTCDPLTGHWTSFPICKREGPVLILILILASCVTISLMIALVTHLAEVRRWCCWKPATPWRHALSQLTGQYHVTCDEAQLGQGLSDDDYLVPLRADDVQEPIYVEIDEVDTSVHLLLVRQSSQQAAEYTQTRC